jgi:transposase
MCGKTIIEAQDMDRNHSAKICARGTGLRKRSHGCAEGALIEPHPAVKRLGRPLETELRADRLPVADAAEELSAVHVEAYFYDWRDDGLFEKINFALLLQARDVAGREASLSAGISPPVRHSVSNGPSLREAPARFGNWTVETVKRAADAAGFAWLNRNCCLARDFEASIASKAWVYITSVQLLIRRLA